MGRKTSVWLPDDLAERVKDSGMPLAELIRRGLGADAPDPLEVRLAAVIRAEFEARFRPGSPVMPVVESVPAPAKRSREKTHGGRDDTPARPRHAPAGTGDVPDGPAAEPAGEGSRKPGDPRAAGAASPRGAQPPGRRDGPAAEPPPAAVFSGPVARTAADVAAQLETVQARGSGHAQNCKCFVCKPPGAKK